MDNLQQANIGPTRSTSEKQRPPPISPSEFAELFGGTFRSNAVAMVRRQPNFDHTKMDDVELLFWGRYYGAYDGTNITDNEATEELRKHAKTILD
ncbi:uncharacterized protein LAESUDRAFT_755658 [Laetiporus sulphureus 93-53]|uniref:Uncharacterized protein n=1 Tax=Laetiporus sulphureus 93-53 TaxID=1314785 RepID=A0A165GZD8_9APHY|nr:uncharacterized protein LAESUDRAFT_755658 [Laetiporus sulphureus 93-53]KZT11037.1 hypothetical protein LAESUDRAFT_755658 [Laetiporus sulphureus 93-53]